MTADHIRLVADEYLRGHPSEKGIYSMLAEIAAQLAELNALLKNVADAVLPLEK